MLIHGITGNWRGFISILPSLTMRWRIYALDLRGHGKSGHITGHYTLYDYEKDVKAFIEQVMKEPVILFGHSLGGMIATMCAADNSKIKAVIIGDSPPNYENNIVEDIEYRASYWRRAKRTASEGETFDEILHSLKENETMWGDVPIIEPLALRNMALDWSRMDPEILTNMTLGKEGVKEMFSGYDTGELFPKISCPVLLIRGNPELGGAIKDAEVEKAKELIPDLSYVYLPDIGHALFLFGAEPVLSKIAAFLESLR